MTQSPTPSGPEQPPPQDGAALHRAILILTAIATLGVVALITLTILRNRPQPAPPDPAAPGAGAAGVVTPADTDSPPVIAKLPPFSLTERSDKPVSLDDLRGKAWIACFIFTHCEGPCPMLTSRMSGFQTKLESHPRAADIRLVSISVDPERDTPERLREYARLAHADPDRWLMLTGKRDAIWTLAREGFKVPVGDNPGDVKMPIFHTQNFVLIDKLGRVRGFYDGLSDDARAKLLTDLDRVLAE